jgi:catechol 2,3-dioxygenase-like lactoylglutathione lyase family enzyme
MNYSGSLYVALNKDETVEFYQDIMGLEVINDFGTNFTFTGGFSFQTIDSWAGFIDMDVKQVNLGSYDGELYFETEELEEVIQKIEAHPEIKYIHQVKEHDWGQRGLRILDPNQHIIEISETLGCLCKRLKNSGLSLEEISIKTYLPIEMIQYLLA